MKKIVAVSVLLVFVFASCTTTTEVSGPKKNFSYPHDGILNNAVLAVKDYQAVDIIFCKINRNA